MDYIQKGGDIDLISNSLSEKIKTMHNLQIGHGDLHPGNILLDSENEPFIIDFGHSYKYSKSEMKKEIKKDRLRLRKTLTQNGIAKDLVDNIIN